MALGLRNHDMKTQELIKLLQQCPPNSDIFFDMSDNERNSYSNIRQLDVEIVNKINNYSEFKIGDVLITATI